MRNILILEDDGIKKRKWFTMRFDVLMPRSERDGKCILPDVEFGTVEVK